MPWRFGCSSDILQWDAISDLISDQRGRTELGVFNFNMLAQTVSVT